MEKDMKIIMKQIVRAAIAAVSVCLVLGGCEYAAQEAAGAAYGTAVIRIAPGGARTIMPTALTGKDVSRYVITLDPDTPDDTADDIVFGDNEGDDTSVITGEGVVFSSLVYGNWIVTVDAYRFIGEEEYKAAAGTADFTALPGALITITVNLLPIAIADAEGAAGLFVWNLSLPGGAELTAFTLGEHDFIADGNVGAILLNPGFYDLSITLINPETERSGGLYEIVYIYPGLITEANYDFREGGNAPFDLNAGMVITGNLNVTRTGPAGETSEYIVRAYYDADCGTELTGAAAAVNAQIDASGSVPYVLEISMAQYKSLAEEIVYLKADCGAGYRSGAQPVAAVQIPDPRGKTGANVSLSVIKTYTITYNVNGGSPLPGFPASTVVDYGAPYELAVNVQPPANLMADDYSFNGWWTASSGGVRLTDEAGASLASWTGSGDIPVYAQFDVGYSTRFDFNGVTVNGVSKVLVSKYRTIASSDEIPWPLPGREYRIVTGSGAESVAAITSVDYGKVFLGWYNEPSGGSPRTVSGMLVNPRRTFYAHWFDTEANQSDVWEYDSAAGSAAAVFSYVGEAVPCPALPPIEGALPYLFEAWGADGGVSRGSTPGGKGGYAKGTLVLNSASPPPPLYFYVGLKPYNPNASYNIPVTWNGGGRCGRSATSLWWTDGSGGGASSISLASGAWDNETVLARRIMVAGGGGGGDYTAGRDGGGFVGGSGAAAGGGAQTAGGAGWNPSDLATNGAWGQGGSGGKQDLSGWNGEGYSCGGGGGGGYYGGGGSADHMAGTGGGGGSGYVFGIDGAGNSVYENTLKLSFSQYQFQDGWTVAAARDFSGNVIAADGFVINPLDLDDNPANDGGGCIRVSYTYPVPVPEQP
jgi:hypothetical protein